MTPDESYEIARRRFMAAYQDVMASSITPDEARQKRADIVARLQVQAVAQRVPDELRPILNGQAAAYEDISKQDAA